MSSVTTLIELRSTPHSAAGAVSGDLHALWLYVTAPALGAALAVLVYGLIRGEPDGLGPPI